MNLNTFLRDTRKTNTYVGWIVNYCDTLQNLLVFLKCEADLKISLNV